MRNTIDKKPVLLPRVNVNDDNLRTILLNQGQALSIDVINWKEYPLCPEVDVHIAHDDSYLWALYRVNEYHVRGVNLDDMGPVYEDSCVEWFLQMPHQETYFNIEVNCVGTCLASCRMNRTDKAAFAQEDLNLIVRFTTFPHQSYETISKSEPIHWECIVGVPKAVLMKYIGTESAMFPEEFSANFYKCGDKTQEPHYLSSFPIYTDSPNFHVPSAFYPMRLE